MLAWPLAFPAKVQSPAKACRPRPRSALLDQFCGQAHIDVAVARLRGAPAEQPAAVHLSHLGAAHGAGRESCAFGRPELGDDVCACAVAADDELVAEFCVWSAEVQSMSERKGARVVTRAARNELAIPFPGRSS